MARTYPYQFQGRVFILTVAKTASYTVALSDAVMKAEIIVILVDTSEGEVTVSLLDPSLVTKKTFIVKRTTGTPNAVIIDVQ